MLKHFTIVIFLVTICVHAYPQADLWAYNKVGYTKRIDSLSKILPALQGSKRIDCLNDLGESYLRFNCDTAKYYAQLALQEAQAINYVAGQAMAYRSLGRRESILGTDAPSIEKFFSKSLALYIKTGVEREIGWALAAVGLTKWVLGKFPEAIDDYEKAVQIFKKISDTTNLSSCYDWMSRLELEWGHYAKSLEYALNLKDLTGQELDFALLFSAIGDYETSLEYYRKYPPPPPGTDDEGMYVCLGLGGIFTHEKQYDSALYYYQYFSDYAKKHGSGPLIKLYAGLGRIYGELKNYDTALVYLNKSLAMSEKAKDQNQVMNTLLILGQTYKAKGNYEAAMVHSLKLLKMASETGARQHIRDAHFLLYQLFDHLHQKNIAYQHLQQYTVLRDSLDLDLSAQKLAFYKTKSEREQSQARINLLKEEKKLQQKELKSARDQKKFLFTGILSLLLIGLVLFRNVLLKRKTEQSLRELAENDLKIHTLESERKQARLQQQATYLEMEALRAQMNPHFIFNCLNAINGFILVNEPETASDYLTKFSRLIRMVLNNSKKQFISVEDELETVRLYLYMESLRFKDNFFYKIDCDNTVDAAALFIPPMLLQPFVENAIWHGLMHKEGFRKLIIDLHFEDNILFCTITDNGIGRKKASQLKSKSAEKNKSMGMDITKNRMALLNQDFDGQCFFEIKDLEDERGNAAGTQVFLKLTTSEVPAENILRYSIQKTQ